MAGDLVMASISNHHLYYVIARRNLEQGRAIHSELERKAEQDAILDAAVVAQFGKPDPDYNTVAVGLAVELLERQDQHLSEAVVFAALAAEAFINYYAVRKTSSSHFKKMFDSLTPEQKWLFIPAMLNNSPGFDPGKQPMQALKYLVGKRNALVHAKPQTAAMVNKQGEISIRPLTAGRYGGPSLDDARKCVETVEKLVKSLKAIDATVQVDWLDDDRPNRLYLSLPNRI